MGKFVGGEGVDVLNLIHNRLEEKNFSFAVNEGSVISDIGLSLYQNDIYKVLVYKVEKIDLNEIKNVAFKIRNFFISNNLNVWNAYLLICSNKVLEKEMVYLLERDTLALRKYVVQTEKDLSRIPFLDNIINTESHIFIEEKNIHLKNTYVNVVYDYLKNTEGRDRLLLNEEVRDVVSNILSLVDQDEDKKSNN